ncbi:hypothetical protein [Gorillibacterium sp. CAU 1737]|uniref:hypothetical protein n=1 Tax=Gorillibacterium sp. CAU 1737 TaxID=3140362 RepID=UPI003260500D
MEDVQLALYISFLEVECATTIYVDEVGDVLKKVRARLERFPEAPPVVSFLRELKKLESLKKRRRNRLDKLLAMDFDALQLSEKKDVAYELADSKKPEHKALGAQYFLRLYQETNDLHLFCNYASTLYGSGGKKQALEVYERIEELFRTEVYPSKGWVMLGIHADRMDFHKEDRHAFRAHWEAAKADPLLKEVTCEFPGYLGYVADFAEVGLKYGYLDLCDEMVALLKKEKLPIPPKVKEYDEGQRSV